MPLGRITITIPKGLVAAADRRARELDRSRSWVITEAVRQYLAAPSPRRVAEPQPPAYPAPAGLGSYRVAQLEADLELTPEERVLEAERTARLDKVAAWKRPHTERIIVFNRYDDYLEWKRREDSVS
jgi:hypothetical protein